MTLYADAESERLKQRMRKFASLLYEHVTHLSRHETKELIKKNHAAIIFLQSVSVWST